MRSRIAIFQSEWTTDVETNLQRMESLVIGLHDDWGDKVKLVTFCELAVSGFHPKRLRENAQTIPGPATDRLAKLAEMTGYFICNGSMLELDGDEIFNTTIIVSPSGEIVHKYRKTHPWAPPVGGETVGVGREFPVTDIPGVGKVGTMICYDGYFPECARSLAFNGAQIILWNSMGMHPMKEATVATAVTRALENSCYVVLGAGVGVHVGIGLHGNSMIVDPNGVTIVRAGEATTIAMDIVDTELVRIAQEEGTKGMLMPWVHLRQFNHSYPHELSRRTDVAVGKD